MDFLNNTDGSENTNDGFSVDTACALEFNEPEKPEKKTSFAQELFEWLDVLSAAIIAVVIIFSLIFRVATISGPSMENTLFGEGDVKDKVIITNLAYTPKYGDIVVISRNVENSVESMTDDNVPIIKRVIAVGGQTVDIDFDEGFVYVDGKKLDEPYIKNPTTRKHEVEFPLYVPEGYIFVLGDNRDESLDSRSIRIGEGGLIDTRYILGHAVLRIYPFDRISKLTEIK